MNNNKRFPTTFTLIEMLIVIVIIGILAAAIIPRLQSLQGRARDTKRKADLLQIYNSNEIYRLDNNDYVRAWTCAYNALWCHMRSFWVTGGAIWIIGLTWYIYPLPVDPINNAEIHYSYGNVLDTPWSAIGMESYELWTTLENLSDPARCSERLYRNVLNGVACNSLLTGWAQWYILSPHNLQRLP